MPVSFVIPCYEEEEALAALRRHLDPIPADEIVFVDDGSTDGTAALLRDLAGSDERIRIVTHEHNRGVGAAMRTGIQATTGDVVVVYDADRTYPLEDAERLIAALSDDISIATATPFGAGGGLEDVSAGRSFLSKAAVWAYRLVLGRRARGISVFTCAFRAYRARLAQRRLPSRRRDAGPGVAGRRAGGRGALDAPAQDGRQQQDAGPQREPGAPGHPGAAALGSWARQGGRLAPGPRRATRVSMPRKSAIQLHSAINQRLGAGSSSPRSAATFFRSLHTSRFASGRLKRYAGWNVGITR